MAETLWCNHIRGPDDIFASPDKATAEARAAEHNAWLDKMFWDGKMEFGGEWPERESCTMQVIKWPHDAEGHARDLRTNVFAARAARDAAEG